MTRRLIALFTLSATLMLPLLTGCENKRVEDDDDGGTLKVDTEGSNKGITVKDND